MSETEYIYREGELFEGRLVVAFSALNVQAGKFEFKTQFEPMKGARLYLNCPDNGFYFNGVPGFADSLEGIAEALKTYVKDHDVKHIDLIGSGMGAFGAIAVGAMMGANRVFAFSPLINASHDLSPVRKFVDDIPADFSDLTDKIGAATETDFHLFCSEAEIFDLYQALPLVDFDHVHYRSISGSEPGLMKTIRGTDAFLRMLRSIAQGDLKTQFFLPNQGNILRSPELVEAIYEAKQDSRKPDWDAATAKLNKVLEEDPTAETALFLMGIYHMTNRDYRAAAEVYANCAELNPNMRQYKERLEDALTKGKIDDDLLWAMTPTGARPDAEAAVDLTDNSMSVEKRADLAFKGKQFEEAHTLFQSFVTENSKDASLLQRAAISAMKCKDYPTALRLQKVVQTEREGEPAAEHHLGVILLKSGNPKKAIPHLKSAYDSSPDNGGFAHQYAIALMLSGEAGSAIDVLMDYIEEGSPDVGILASLAEFADRAKMPETRLVAAEKLMSVDGGEARGNYERAMALLSLNGDEQEIEQSFRIAATLDENDKRITTAFADFLESTGRSVEARAMRMVSKAL